MGRKEKEKWAKKKRCEQIKRTIEQKINKKEKVGEEKEMRTIRRTIRQIINKKEKVGGQEGKRGRGKKKR